MFGVLGLVTDLGWGYYRKAAAKAAAQAAALASAQAALASAGGGLNCTSAGVSCQTSYQCPTTLTVPGDDLQNGCLYAKDNGFQVIAGGAQNVLMSGGTGVPPTVAGLNSSYWATARVSETQPQMFSAVLGNRTATVSARATAIITPDARDCIYIMDPSSSGSLNMTGTSSLVSSCGVYINSSSGSALDGVGTATLSAGAIDIVGGSSFHGTLNPNPPSTGVAVQSDPLWYLPAPNTTSMVVRSTNRFKVDDWDVTTLLPGIYEDGIEVKNGTAIFSPGIYVIKGGGIKTENSNSTITGTGVMIYNTCSSPGICGSSSDYKGFSLSANSIVSLTAPVTGTYAGILIMEDRSIPAKKYSDTFGGGSSASYEGTIYAPKSNVKFYGNASSSNYAVLVAYQLEMVGTTNVNNNYASLPNGSPLKKIALVE
jgi:hypothetical protein